VSGAEAVFSAIPPGKTPLDLSGREMSQKDLDKFRAPR
jgi:hypothetical protein